MQNFIEEKDVFKHWFFCRNRLFFDDYIFLICLADPRVYIKIEIDKTFHTDTLNFKNISSVQWLDGRPDIYTQKKVLKSGFEFLFKEIQSHEQLNISIDDLITEF